MLKEIKKLGINELEINKWQIEGIKKNPRFIKDEKYLKLKKSLEESPEFLALRELVVYPYNNKYVIIWWNMRYRRLKELWEKEVLCKILEENTSIDKINEFIIKDNVWYWEHDMELLANDWEILTIEEWGVDFNFWNTDEMSDDFTLPNWEKWEIETVTFTLHKEQNKILQEALNLSKTKWAFINTWNENWNWNALARIVETYLTQN